MIGRVSTNSLFFFFFLVFFFAEIPDCEYDGTLHSLPLHFGLLPLLLVDSARETRSFFSAFPYTVWAGSLSLFPRCSSNWQYEIEGWPRNRSDKRQNWISVGYPPCLNKIKRIVSTRSLMTSRTETLSEYPVENDHLITKAIHPSDAAIRRSQTPCPTQINSVHAMREPPRLPRLPTRPQPAFSAPITATALR